MSHGKLRAVAWGPVNLEQCSEGFRKTLPTYTRSQVVLLGDEYFAYSDFDGARSRTHVLRITDRLLARQRSRP